MPRNKTKEVVAEIIDQQYLRELFVARVAHCTDGNWTECVKDAEEAFKVWRASHR